ncbi:MAG: methionine--tRNA ligase subunit beta [Nanoarchaeota archaeon]
MIETIKFEDWKKLDIRVGQIKEVKDHPNADKLLVMKVDIGNEIRTVVAGIKKYYSKEELVGKKVIVFANLEQKELRGIKSEGMILAAEQGDGGKVILLKPEKDIENGSVIR